MEQSGGHHGNKGQGNQESAQQGKTDHKGELFEHHA